MIPVVCKSWQGGIQEVKSAFKSLLVKFVKFQFGQSGGAESEISGFLL